MDWAEIERTLRDFLRGNWAILGIGNRLRGDDGFGSFFAEKLKAALASTPFAERIYDGGIAPENYYGKLARQSYDRVLIVDAVVFDGAPGEIRFFRPEDLTSSLVMSHGPTSFEFLRALMPNADILILAVRPEKIRIGDKISPFLNEVIEHLVGWIIVFLLDK